MNWIYQILKALLDWLRETPERDIHHGKVPKDLKDSLRNRIRDLPGLPDKGRDR